MQIINPSDIIHNRVDEMLKREIETGCGGMYQPGYVDKLVTAILEYLDKQAEQSTPTKEKSLEEKFREFLIKRFDEEKGTMAYQLAVIAFTHFESNPVGKSV